MSRPLWFVAALKRAFPGRFLAARATQLPLLGPLLHHELFRGDDLFYLPPDGTIQIHESIELPEQTVLPSAVVDHFIRAASVHWVMNRCICRDASGCEDYPVDLGCLFLGEAANGINPKLGRRVSREEALDHLRHCREAGLVHLIGRNRLDTVWLGVRPGDRLLTICNCCPCCCLWRMLPYTSPRIAETVGRMPGVTVTVSERCIGCGACVEGGCFVDAIELTNGHTHISEACRGCGRCVAACPNGAIELSIADGFTVEGAVKRIAALVDVSGGSEGRQGTSPVY
jgi:ferredoxin